MKLSWTTVILASLSLGAGYLLGNSGAVSLRASSRTPWSGPERLQYYYNDIYTPFFVRDARDPGFYVSRRPGAPRDSFSAVKSTETFRIFVVGSSIADQYMNARLLGLEAALRGAVPGLVVKAVDCGMPGYDAYRDSLVVKEILGYSPDMILVLNGHDEGEGTVMAPRWKIWAAAVARYVKPLGPMAGRLLAPYGADAAQRDAAYLRYTAAMVRMARNRGVPIVLCSPPLDYRDQPSADIRQVFNADFVPGWRLYLKGDLRAAQIAWRRALDGLPAGADAERARLFFYLARCADEMRNWPQARELYVRAMEADPLGFTGAPPHRLAEIRDLAAREGAVWVDLDGAFRQQAAPELPDLEQFNDGTHWRHSFDPLVSIRIVEAMRRSGLFRTLRWSDAGIRGLRGEFSRLRGLEYDNESQAIFFYALQDIERSSALPNLRSQMYLSWLLAHEPSGLKAYLPWEMHRQGSGEGFSIGGESSQGLEPLLHWHIGQALLEMRRYNAAIGEFSMALSRAPKLKRILLSEGVAYALAGDTVRATEAFDKAEKSGFAEEAQVLRKEFL